MEEQHNNKSIIISGIICIILGILVINFGFKYINFVLGELDANCKTCSYFDKDCPYTDKELIDQEYDFSNPYCSDMGIYEMKFKVFGGGAMAVGLGLLSVGAISMWNILKPKKRGLAVNN